MGDAARAAHAMHGLGLLALNDSDLETARLRLEEALNLHLESGTGQTTRYAPTLAPYCIFEAT